MRLIAAFLMLILLLSPSLLRLGLLGYYQLNKAEITRLHCINRDKPMLHCEGKCYLNAQLERAQREQESMEGIFAGWNKAEDLLPPPTLVLTQRQPLGLSPSSAYPYLLGQGIGYRFDVFRPPPTTGIETGLFPHGRTVEHDQIC